MVRSFTIILILTAVLPSAVQADPIPEFAWFTLESPTCTDINVLFEGSQQALTINKNNDSSCNLTIGYNLTANYAPLAGYAFQLFNTPEVSLLAIDQSPGDLIGFNTHFVFNTAGSFVHVGGLNFSPDGSPGGLVTRITVRINKPSITGIHNIFGNYGASAQAYNNGYLWYGRVGPNQPTYGQPGYSPVGWGPLPVISIRNVPEPMTLGLLCVPLLFRRRNFLTNC